MYRTVFVVGATALMLCGCAVRRPEWARLGNTSTANDPQPAFHRDPHHQYYDKGRKRFYYYDPDQKRFFWENGEPKG